VPASTIEANLDRRDFGNSARAKGQTVMASEIEPWFASAPENQKRVLLEPRALVLSVASGIVEEYKWSRPCYSIAAGGKFCYLHRTKDHVTIGFDRGASLRDPQGLLEGTGKLMRHVWIRAFVDIDRPALLALLHEAVESA
jgi:hypothetical protein